MPITCYSIDMTGVLLFFFVATNQVVAGILMTDMLGCEIIIGTPSCDRSMIRYILYTKSHPDGEELTWQEYPKTFLESSFKSKAPTKVIVHGYNADSQDEYIHNYVQAYLKNKRVLNIIVVDYRRLAKKHCYLQAVHNLQHAGTCVGHMINALRQGQDLDIHIIGLSLGGQIPVYVANHVKPYIIPRVTCLDPAGPLFKRRRQSWRVNPNVAKFVDVLHTSSFYGSLMRLGHADFFVNGGATQPGCDTKQGNNLCDHFRAFQYFGESINSTKGFYGYKCSDVRTIEKCKADGKKPVLMGDQANEMFQGIFYVKTSESTPFARGKYF